MQALVPRLLQQEKFIFDELVSYMWTHTLVPRIAASRWVTGDAVDGLCVGGGLRPGRERRSSISSVAGAKPQTLNPQP